MTLTAVDTPLGPGEVFILKGHVRHLSLPNRTLDGIPVQVSVHDLGDMDGFTDATLPDRVAGATSQAAPWLDQFEAQHRTALNHLSRAGLPADLQIERAAWQLTVAAPDKRRPEITITHSLTVMYYISPKWVSVYLDMDGNADILLSGEQLNDIFATAGAEAKRAAAPKFTHSVFGNFKPDTLTSLKRKMVNGKRVAIDLYLPQAAIDTFAADDLDPFVPLVETLPDLATAVCRSALPYKADWLADRLDPANAHLLPALLKAFPKAQSDGIEDEAFFEALWLSRICLAPFGTGPSDEVPSATWDLHVLPKGRDDTIFAVKTSPDGTVLSVTPES